MELKTIIIYVHHYYCDSLLYKLIHNTNSKELYINDDKIGYVLCKYKNILIKWVFNPTIHDAIDGYHLIDFYTTREQRGIDTKYNNINLDDIKNLEDSISVANIIYNNIKDKKDWIILFLRTEKLFYNYEVSYSDNLELSNIDNSFKKLKNHKIISDNCFLNDIIESRYPNHYFAFTNTIYQWNEMIGIRWFYEFNQIYKNLNFNYNMGYSVRNYKRYRTELLIELSNMKIDKLFLSKSDAVQSKLYFKELPKLENIPTNSIIGNTDFDNLTYIPWHIGFGLDYYFRILSKSKMQILDESWARESFDFASQYLSEKTFGLILAGIPFISTHSYPLHILEKILGIREHPFKKESIKIQGNPTYIALFIKTFMTDFDKNYILCKDWIDECRELFLNKLNSENSLLDLMIIDFKNENKVNTKLI
jgi:hypothetical protein